MNWRRRRLACYVLGGRFLRSDSRHSNHREWKGWRGRKSLAVLFIAAQYPMVRACYERGFKIRSCRRCCWPRADPASSSAALVGRSRAFVCQTVGGVVLKSAKMDRYKSSLECAVTFLKLWTSEDGPQNFSEQSTTVNSSWHLSLTALLDLGNTRKFLLRSKLPIPFEILQRFYSNVFRVLEKIHWNLTVIKPNICSSGLQ